MAFGRSDAHSMVTHEHGVGGAKRETERAFGRMHSQRRWFSDLYHWARAGTREDIRRYSRFSWPLDGFI